ncbi:hypothetical protein FOZ62_032423 [Perkinsus olseni]|uniref:Uncharacterized protein n=1 Tax=Perkinsus olseni TaxID=32597 RepID=A0A7J6SLF0_PEROL|nr:hypothetical protein FOZ62_032423 [Perkinsus olseni]
MAISTESRRGSAVSEARAIDEFEDESEVRGTLYFSAPVEVLPRTQRTADLLASKAAERQRRREEAAALRRQKEEEEAQRRLREQEAKKLKLLMKQRQKEEEQRKREEEEQRKQLEGGLDKILAQLHQNTSNVQAVTLAGMIPADPGSGIRFLRLMYGTSCTDNCIDIGSVRLRLLCNALIANRSCTTITLARKCLSDEDGVSLSAMLEVNRTLEYVDLEGNALGPNTARRLGEVLAGNNSLKYLNLRDNDLTSSGNDQEAVAELCRGLDVNESLMVLLLGRNNITSVGGEHLLEYARNQRTRENCPPHPVTLDVMENSLTVEQMRDLQAIVDANAADLHSRRVLERNERLTMQEAYDDTREWLEAVERERIDVYGIENRRNERVRGSFEEWKLEVENRKSEETGIQEELMREAEERKDARKGKKKGKKK